jgi:NADH/NAD ratio-sensing transcriptional regulator Rex
MRKHLPFNRRRFIGSLPAIAASIQIVPRHVLGGQGTLSPNEIPTKAVIGVGGMGRGHLKSVNPGAKLVAVCDVDKGHLKTALEQSGPDVKGYEDFREVIARKDVDIVHIPTPPHWHALI